MPLSIYIIVRSLFPPFLSATAADEHHSSLGLLLLPSSRHTPSILTHTSLLDLPSFLLCTSCLLSSPLLLLSPSPPNPLSLLRLPAATMAKSRMREMPLSLSMFAFGLLFLLLAVVAPTPALADDTPMTPSTWTVAPYLSKTTVMVTLSSGMDPPWLPTTTEMVTLSATAMAMHESRRPDKPTTTITLPAKVIAVQTAASALVPTATALPEDMLDKRTFGPDEEECPDQSEVPLEKRTFKEGCPPVKKKCPGLNKRTYGPDEEECPEEVEPEEPEEPEKPKKPPHPPKPAPPVTVTATPAQPSTVIVTTTQKASTTGPEITASAKAVLVGEGLFVEATRTFDPRVPIPTKSCPRLALAALAYWRDFCGQRTLKQTYCYQKAPSIERCCGYWVNVDDPKYFDYPPVMEGIPHKLNKHGPKTFRDKPTRKEKGKIQKKVVLPQWNEYNKDGDKGCARWQMFNIDMYRFYTQAYDVFGIRDVDSRGRVFNTGTWDAEGDGKDYPGLADGGKIENVRKPAARWRPECYCGLQVTMARKCLCQDSW